MKLGIISQHILGTVSYFTLFVLGSYLFFNLLGSEDTHWVTAGKVLLVALGYFSAVTGPLVSYAKGIEKREEQGWQLAFAAVYIVYALLFIGVVSVAGYFMFSV